MVCPVHKSYQSSLPSVWGPIGTHPAESGVSVLWLRFNVSFPTLPLEAPLAPQIAHFRDCRLCFRPLFADENDDVVFDVRCPYHDGAVRGGV